MQVTFVVDSDRIKLVLTPSDHLEKVVAQEFFVGKAGIVATADDGFALTLTCPRNQPR